MSSCDSRLRLRKSEEKLSSGWRDEHNDMVDWTTVTETMEDV